MKLPRWIPWSLLTVVMLAGGSAQGQDGPTTESAMSELPPGSSVATPGFRRLARQIEARSRALDRRERTMGQRIEDLRLAEDALAERVAELTAAREALEVLLNTVDEAEQERLTGLVKMSEKMRDKQAAALFTELEPALAVKVLDRMNRAKAGKALAAMEPRRAARLAERLTRPIELKR